MRHADISAALDALGKHFGITLKHRPNYSGGRINLQLTPIEQPIVAISFDEGLFELKDRTELSDLLHKHFDNASRLLCGAAIVNACVSGREPSFETEALPVEDRREICDQLGRVFLALAAGDEMKGSREWLHRRLGLFSVPEVARPPPPKIQKTHRRTIVLGDFHKPGSDETHVRLFSEPNEDGETYWVDFQIFEIVGCDHEPYQAPGRKFFNRKGATSSPDPVYTYEEAQPIVDGFVKWDGCTQFEFPDGVHVDCKRHLEALFSAVGEARKAAAELMGPTWDCRREYE